MVYYIIHYSGIDRLYFAPFVDDLEGYLYSTKPMSLESLMDAGLSLSIIIQHIYDHFVEQLDVQIIGDWLEIGQRSETLR